MNKLTIKDACILAGISRPTIYKYINNGKLSSVKEGKNTFIEPSELIRVFPNSQLSTEQSDVNNLHSLTQEIKHKGDIINMLEKQLNDKQKDNEFLKDQLTTISKNFTQLNNLIEDKKPQAKKKFLGIF